MNTFHNKICITLKLQFLQTPPPTSHPPSKTALVCQHARDDRLPASPFMNRVASKLVVAAAVKC